MRHIIISDDITESCFSLDNISVVIDTDHTYISVSNFKLLLFILNLHLSNHFSLYCYYR